jgi:peptidyl-prolyl cis-trans isomerase-like 2
MVKRQKEKQYQSAREHKENAQERAGTASSSSQVQRRLPFGHCALGLTPCNRATDPVCTHLGIVFDPANLLPFVHRHDIDPVTGTPLTSRDLITLVMHRHDNDNGTKEETEWYCPVLNKRLADHMKIVAIRQPQGHTAHVYSYEAYHELNVKPKSYVDLLSGEPFDKSKDGTCQYLFPLLLFSYVEMLLSVKRLHANSTSCLTCDTFLFFY